MIAWTQLEPGLGRSVAYNVIILCGVSTLFMNGNPLLRYDGYYVLSDAIEIPNLGQRAPMPGSGICSSATCWAWPPSRRRAPAGASSGGSWAGALLSFVYRMFIMFLAIFLVAGSSSASCWPAGPS